MFEIGSYVIYRAEGVCVISDIRKENFGSLGNENEYYILTPVSNKSSTVFVPVSNEKLVSLIRPLMSAIEIERMLDEIRNDRIEWINDSRARNTAFKEILSSGDRRELCVLAITVFEKAEQITKNNKKVCPTRQTFFTFYICIAFSRSTSEPPARSRRFRRLSNRSPTSRHTPHPTRAASP